MKSNTTITSTTTMNDNNHNEYVMIRTMSASVTFFKHTRPPLRSISPLLNMWALWENQQWFVLFHFLATEQTEG